MMPCRARLSLTKLLTRITVSIFIPDQDNKGKSKHASSSKKPFPFVEVQAKG